MQDQRERYDRRTGAGLLMLWALVVIGLLVGGRWFFLDQSDILGRQARSQIEAIGDLQAETLQEWRSARIAEATVFYDNPGFVSLVRRVIDTDDPVALSELRDWLANLQANPSYESVQLIDTQGEVVGAISSGDGFIDDHVREVIEETPPSGEISWVDLHRNEGHVHMSLIVPLIDRDLDATFGTLVLIIDPEKYLYPYLGKWPLPSETGESLIVRREGDEVLFLSPLRFRDDAEMELRVSIEDDHLPAVKGVLGQEGAVESVDYRGAEVVSTVNRIPGTEWILVSKVDTDEAYSRVRDRLAAILIAIGAVVALVTGFVIAWWRHTRNRQLRARMWLREVIESSSDEVYTFDSASLRFTFVNRGIALNLGYTPQELFGMRVSETMPDLSEEDFDEKLATLRSGERERLVLETVHRRKDGSHYPVEASIQYFVTEHGPQYLTIGSDITARRESESIIAQRLEYEEATASSMRILLTDDTMERRLHAVLLTLLEASGASRVYIFRNEEDPESGLCMSQIAEVVADGVTPEIDNPRLQRLPYEPDAPTLLPALLERKPYTRVVDEMRTDESVMRFDLEAQDVKSVLILPIYVKDELWGNIGFDDCKSVRRWKDNDVCLLQVVADGIAAALEREATALELADHRAGLERLVDRRTAELGAVNKELDVVNEELLSNNEQLACMNEELEASNDELQAANVELEIALNELERANTDLAAANETKSVFLASMSHELRTPLNSVIGFSGILGQGLSGPLTEEQVTQVGMINKSGRHLLALIDDILDLSKVEAGSVRLDIDEFDLVEVACEVIDSVRPMAEEKGIEISLETKEDATLLTSDSGKVWQILLNLTANAVKFTDAGSVRVSIDSHPGAPTRVLISDTGCGIPRDAFHSIFDPFVQFDLPGKAKTKGTGLGLALSREYAHLLGGEITVRSQEGVGSTFTLVLPLRR